MPFTHGKSTAVFLGGTDVSSFLNSVDQTITRDVSESSTFGSQAKSYLKGHKDGTISLSGYWDGASGAIDSVMASALGNEVLGYVPVAWSQGSDGELLANYANTQLVNQDTTTPIAGFNASMEFGDNSFARYAVKGVNDISGVRYLVSCFIRMNDGAAPVLSGTPDFVFLWDGGIVNATFSELVSGNIYRVALVIIGTGAASPTTAVYKGTTGYSAKGFRMSGLTVQAVATVQQTRQVDTYGPELLAAGETIGSYPVQGNVSQASTPIAGLSGSVQFGDNSVTRNAYKTYASYVLGAQYFFRALMQMNDDSVPTVGTQSSIFDATLVVHGDISYGFNTGPAPLVSRLSGAIYEVTYRFTCVNLNNTTAGFAKYAGLNSARQFRAGGYSLRQITPVTVPTAPPLSICEAGTATAGLRALVVQAHDTSYQVTGTTGDTVAVSCEFQVDGSFGSGAFRGVVLAPLTSYGTGTNTAAVDNGSTTFGGLVANFHVLANTEWVTIKIQHSTNNSTWVDLMTSTSFSASSSEHLITPNVVYRYLRVNVTASGSTTPRLIVTAARK